MRLSLLRLSRGQSEGAGGPLKCYRAGSWRIVGLKILLMQTSAFMVETPAFMRERERFSAPEVAEKSLLGRSGP